MKAASKLTALIAVLAVLATPAFATTAVSTLAVSSPVVADSTDTQDGGASVDGYNEECD